MALDPKHLEFVVLIYVIERHPDHPTSSELISELGGRRDGEDDQIRRALQALKDADLLQENRDLIEPTSAALRAASILTL